MAESAGCASPRLCVLCFADLQQTNGMVAIKVPALSTLIVPKIIFARFKFLSLRKSLSTHVKF